MKNVMNAKSESWYCIPEIYTIFYWYWKWIKVTLERIQQIFTIPSSIMASWRVDWRVKMHNRSNLNSDKCLWYLNSWKRNIWTLPSLGTNWSTLVWPSQPQTELTPKWLLREAMALLGFLTWLWNVLVLASVRKRWRQSTWMTFEAFESNGWVWVVTNIPRSSRVVTNTKPVTPRSRRHCSAQTSQGDCKILWQQNCFHI